MNNQLDAFQYKCFRRILKVPHLCYSHVLNKQILDAANIKPLSSILFVSQLNLFGKVAVMQINHPIRLLVFDDTNPFDHSPLHQTRRVRRPRITWVYEMHCAALTICGSSNEFAQIIGDDSTSSAAWSNKIKEHMSATSID